MASETYGNVGEFDQATENWAGYMERMEQYFLSNEETTNNKKTSNFTEHLWSNHPQSDSKLGSAI